MGFDPATQAMWDGAAAVRYQAFRAGDREAYEGCCAAIGPPGDHLILGDTLRAIEAFADRLRGRPRFNANSLNLLWTPEMDAARSDPRFQGVFDEILEYAGLEGAVLKRAPAED